MPITFSNGQIHALTLATDAPGGFLIENLGHIHEILPLVSRFAEVHSDATLVWPLLIRALMERVPKKRR